MTCRAWIMVLFLSVSTALVSGSPTVTATFVDDPGRTVTLPDVVNKAMAAGQPDSVLLQALALERMAGWVRQPTSAEREFLAAPARTAGAHSRATTSL